MRVRVMAFVLLALLFGLAGSAARAQQTTADSDASTRYVDDIVTVSVRTGRGTDFRILRTIESGERVQALETTADGYTRVRLSDGVEGWMLTRYLNELPPARLRLADAEQRTALNEQENASLRATVEALTAENEATKGEVSRLYLERQVLDAELDRLRETLGDPSSAPAMLEVMRGRVGELQAELDTLNAESGSLRDQTRRWWFLAGAGVLLAGIVLGLILPRLRPRRRSSWGSL